MNVRNRVGGTRIFDEQVVDFLVFAVHETDSEISLRQSANVVADVGILAGHVDNHIAERPLFNVLVLFRFQHAHKTEVLGRDFGVEVALQDGVRHLVTKDDEPAATCPKQTFGTAFDIFDNAFVTFIENDENRVNPLSVR